MDHLTFWLHMNDEYMWRWFCSTSDGTVFAMSARSFFRLTDAEDALHSAQSFIGQTALAA